MTWWAVGTAAVGIIGGAISSKQQADAANRTKTSTTNQTTTQRGNYDNELQPDFRQLMQLNRSLMEGGPTYISGGHTDYTGKGWPGGGHAGGPGPDTSLSNVPQTGGKTVTPEEISRFIPPVAGGGAGPPDNQDGPPANSDINPNGVPTTNDVRPLSGASSWYPGGGGSGDGSVSRLPASGGLPSGASRRPDGRVILASGETQGMTKGDRHRAWEDWKKSRAGMPG